MPIEALVNTSCPCRSNGRPSSSLMRSAMRVASLGDSMASARMANSSPPSRATVSPGRRKERKRRAMEISSRSPTAWPRLSLTFLKRSRSRNSTAN